MPTRLPAPCGFHVSPKSRWPLALDVLCMAYLFGCSSPASMPRGQDTTLTDAASPVTVAPESGTVGAESLDAADTEVDIDVPDTTAPPPPMDASMERDTQDESTADAGGSTPTTASVLAAALGSCLPCAQGCLNDMINCEVFGGQVAGAGPAAGQSRGALCLSVLSCGLAGTCVSTQGQGGVIFCYCGVPDLVLCLADGGAMGACVHEEQAGLETTDPDEALENFSDLTLGGGMANAIMQCLQDEGCLPCAGDGGAGNP